MENIELPELVNVFLVDQNFNETLLTAKINAAVTDLLMNNTAFLYQVLYRIDVKEEKVKRVFLDSPLLEVAAERITLLIIERQKEKVYWRSKYSKGE